MQATTKLAKLLKPALEQVAQRAGISTRGVKLSISTRHEMPCCVFNRIMIPACLADPDEDFGLIARTFLHELQHARDILDGVDLPREDMERRARRAEKLYVCPLAA
jgi:hypothetical protein